MAGTNVGSIEVDVDVDTNELDRSIASAGKEAASDFQSAFEQELRAEQRRLGREAARNLNRTLRPAMKGTGASAGQFLGDGINAGLRRSTRNLGNNLPDIEDSLRRRLLNPFRVVFGTLHRDTTSGMRQLRQQLLGIGASLGPIIVPLVAALGAIAPAAALALPSILALGAGAGVLALGMKDLKSSLSPIADGFRELQGPIGDVLTKGIRPLARDFAGTTIPAMRDGLSGVADVLNDMIGDFLRFSASAQGAKLIGDTLGGLADSLRPLQGLVKPLVSGLLRITQAALPGFKAMNQGIVDLVVRFSDWATRMRESGEAARIISEAASLAGRVLRFLGSAFLGVIDGARILADLLTPAAQLLSTVFERLGITTREFFAALIAGAGVFFLLIGRIGLLVTVITSLANPVTLVVLAIAALGAAFALVWARSEAFRTAVSGLFGTLLRLGQVIWSYVVPAARAVWQLFTSQLLPIIKSTARAVGNNLAPVFSEASAQIAKMIPLVHQVAARFREWWPVIRQATVMMFQLIGSIIKGVSWLVGKLAPIIIRYYASYFPLFVAAARLVWSILQTVWRIALTVASALAGALASAIDRARSAWDAIERAIDSARDAFNNVVGAIDNAIGAIRNIAGGAIDTAIAAINSIINALQALWNLLQRTFTLKINIPKINLPDIPGLANGGIVRAPQLTMIGEGYRPEVVVPMTKPKRAVQLMKEAGLDRLLARDAKQSSAPSGPSTVYESHFHITEPVRNARGFAQQVDNRLRIRLV